MVHICMRSMLSHVMGIKSGVRWEVWSTPVRLSVTFGPAGHLVPSSAASACRTMWECDGRLRGHFWQGCPNMRQGTVKLGGLPVAQLRLYRALVAWWPRRRKGDKLKVQGRRNDQHRAGVACIHSHRGG